MAIYLPVITQTGNYKTGQDSLTDLEYEKLVSACSSFQDELLIKFTIVTALRREDVISVEWSNVKVNPETFTGEFSYYEKKKKRIRTLHIGKNLGQLLIKYSKTCPKGQTHVFPFCGRTAYNKLQELCDIAGIRRRPFHSLRATSIKRCQKAGWTPEQVCELTGDTLRVIQAHYAVPSKSEMEETSINKEIV